MNVTKPQEMISGTSKVEELVSKFEKELSKQEKDQEYYHLVVDREYNRPTCDEVERIYKEAGWQKVKCRTSSEKGERRGLTSLQLFL